MDSYSTRDLWREMRGDVEELELGEFRMRCWELLVAVAKPGLASSINGNM
jgi:hypothetical protein